MKGLMKRYESQDIIYSNYEKFGKRISVKQLIVSDFGDHENKFYSREINALKKLCEIPGSD